MSSPVKITTKGIGTMSMTASPNPKPLEDSVKMLKYVKEKYGVKFINSADFYHLNPEFHNLKLVSEFLKGEDDVSDTVLSIKSGWDFPTMSMKSSNESIDNSIKDIQDRFKDFNPRPKIIYELARTPTDRPIEDCIQRIYEYVKDGTIDGISLSEAGVETIRKCVAIAPISFVEVELSLFSQDIFHNGVLAEASKHGIPIVAYSPVSRGILTDYAAEHKDFLGSMPASDFRHYLDRFSPETYEKNKERLQNLYKFAKSKNVPLETLAISYLESLSGLQNFNNISTIPQIIPIPSGTTTERIDRNFNTKRLSRDDMEAIQQIIKDTEIHGLRYNAAMEGTLFK